MHCVCYPPGLRTKFQIWEVEPHNVAHYALRTPYRMFYRAAKGCLLCYDATDPAGLRLLEELYIPRLLEYVQQTHTAVHNRWHGLPRAV